MIFIPQNAFENLSAKCWHFAQASVSSDETPISTMIFHLKSVVLPIYMQLSTKCYLVIQNIHNKFVIMRKMAHDTEDNIDNNMIW